MLGEPAGPVGLECLTLFKFRKKKPKTEGKWLISPSVLWQLNIATRLHGPKWKSSTTGIEEEGKQETVVLKEL